MLVVLKIPVVYLCAVVWWAIKAEPRPLEGAGAVASLGPGPGPECDWRRVARTCSAAVPCRAAAGARPAGDGSPTPARG